MRKEDFDMPGIMKERRVVVLKGVVYSNGPTLVMATETKCSFTDKEFDGVCVGYDQSKSNGQSIVVIGATGKFDIESYGCKLN